MFECYTSEQHQKGYSCIHVIGDIDINSVLSFKEQMTAIAALSKEDLQIDCSKLTYIDSQGLNVLACVYNKLKPEQRNLSLLNTSPNTKKLLHITGLDKILSIEN